RNLRWAWGPLLRMDRRRRDVVALRPPARTGARGAHAGGTPPIALSPPACMGSFAQNHRELQEAGNFERFSAPVRLCGGPSPLPTSAGHGVLRSFFDPGAPHSVTAA